MFVLIAIVLILVLFTLWYLRLPLFGKAPEGKRLELIQQLPNYKNGRFQNVHLTPDLTEGYSMAAVIYGFLFKKFPRTKPGSTIPSIKTNLKNLSRDLNALVWFGHSSYFMQIDGKRFLVDPVFSGNAAPLPGSNKSFPGTDIYTAADMPEIDYLLITHDHYDHLDYKTIMALKSKVRTVICAMGVVAHFESWGYDSNIIIEKNWHETVRLTNEMTITTAPARHFSGRGFLRNNTLWTAFILQTPNLKIYIGGDSGYDSHFEEAAQKFGEFDLAILDSGQYNPAWQAIHMSPVETLKAAIDLRAKRLFPVHSSKFALAHHPWDEPLKKITEFNQAHNIPLVTPMIGELVNLNDENQSFKQWWKELD